MDDFKILFFERAEDGSGGTLFIETMDGQKFQVAVWLEQGQPMLDVNMGLFIQKHEKLVSLVKE